MLPMLIDVPATPARLPNSSSTSSARFWYVSAFSSAPMLSCTRPMFPQTRGQCSPVADRFVDRERALQAVESSLVRALAPVGEPEVAESSGFSEETFTSPLEAYAPLPHRRGRWPIGLIVGAHAPLESAAA